MLLSELHLNSSLFFSIQFIIAFVVTLLSVVFPVYPSIDVDNN